MRPALNRQTRSLFAWAGPSWLVPGLRAIALLACMPANAVTSPTPVPASTEADRLALGAALFHGTPALPARLRHQDLTLPPRASRCSNCHQGDSQQAALGPRLDANWLLGPRPRHGGPATRYERDSFCRLLRTGIAPADIVVAQAMPTYQLGDAQCDALWRHLTRLEAPHASQPRAPMP